MHQTLLNNNAIKSKSYKHITAKIFNENNIDYSKIDFSKQKQWVTISQLLMSNDIAKALEDCILYGDINVNEYMYNILLEYKKINEWNIFVIYKTLLYNKDNKYLSDVETTMLINIFKEKIYDMDMYLLDSLYGWNQYERVIDDSIFKSALTYKKITQNKKPMNKHRFLI